MKAKSWKETVIDYDKSKLSAFSQGFLDGALKDQAEISVKAGRKEVVEFIHKEFGGYTKAVTDGGELINILIDNDYGEDGSLDIWLSKLKEWGIE